MTSFNPYDVDSHYGLDMACCLVSQMAAGCVRICTENAEIAKAVARRLLNCDHSLVVETPDIQTELWKHLGVPSKLYESSIVCEVALLPFSRYRYPVPPQADQIVVITHNALSYKGILFPWKTRECVFSTISWLRKRYWLKEHVGGLGPNYIMYSGFSQAAGTRWPTMHFLFQQRALDRIYITGHFWWLGYISILSGVRRSDV